MKNPNVTILGATGAVGREMMKVLAERDFPIEELHPLASARSVGQAIHWKGHDLPVELACDEAFKGMDIVLGRWSSLRSTRRMPKSTRASSPTPTAPPSFRWWPSTP